MALEVPLRDLRAHTSLFLSPFKCVFCGGLWQLLVCCIDGFLFFFAVTIFGYHEAALWSFLALCWFKCVV